MVAINIKEALLFFDEGVLGERLNVASFQDEGPNWVSKHASSIAGVVGEALNVACLRHYLVNQKSAKVTIRPEKVTTGKQKGSRLDRWIVVDWPDSPRTVFQTEIKNWSSHSISGKRLYLQASQEEVTQYKEERWRLRWDPQRRELKAAPTKKVLDKMQPPSDLSTDTILPLLIFWEALGPRDQPEPLFHVDLRPSSWREFSELCIFSVSSYLRDVLRTGCAQLTLPMSDVAIRLQILSSLVRMPD